MTKQFNQKTGSRGIEWCDETINVFGGCFHRCRWQMPDGSIAMCYAEDLAENGLAKGGYPGGFEKHYFRPGNLKTLAAGREPKLIFCDSMSDMFGQWVEESQLLQVFDAMRSAPHTYQSLTKSPKRILKYLDALPPNLWIGVSSPPDFFMPAANGDTPAEFAGLGMKPAKRLNRDQQGRYLLSALSVLERVRAETGNITFMSWEPVSWDMAPHIPVELMPDWVIIGAASKGRRYYQPDPAHVAGLLELADAAGTAVFFKGNIKPTFQAHSLGSDRLNRWREDFPGCYRDGGLIPAVVRRQELARQHGWPLNTHFIAVQMHGDTAVQQMSFFD